ITASERATRQVFHELPWQSRDVVREWLAVGHSLRDALIRSNVLGSGPLLTPRDARQQELWANDKREACEHEASHAVAAHALGLAVNYARIGPDHSGICNFTRGTKLQNAIITMAPEIWLTYFRKDVFPYGPTGLKSD